MKPSMAQLTMLKNAKGEKAEIIKTIAPDCIDTSSSGVAREPPPSVAMHHPGGVLTTGE